MADSMSNQHRVTSDPGAGGKPLPGTAPVEPVERSVPHELIENDDLDSETLLAILGGSSRSGEWSPPELLRVVAIMGGVQLDFRQALLPPGITEVHVFALMGGVGITVPRDLDVEITATAFMGGVEQGPHVEQDRASSGSGTSPGAAGGGPGARDAAPPPDRPLLLISGLAIMGGITIKVA